jgi:HEAT repeat protein
MTATEADSILTQYESNHFADLYKSRWDAEYASTVVPNLIKCLEVDDKAILMRTLSALHRIGPEAHSAGLFVCPFLEHPDILVRRTSIYALTGVWYRKGHKAVAPLVRVANDPGMLKDVMFGLLAIGVAAKPAKKIFVAAFDSRDGKIRRLALRGLGEIGAEGKDVMEVLERAKDDKNSEVRSKAVKLIAKLQQK